MDKYKQAIQELMRSVKYMIDSRMEHTTKIYNGLILSISGNVATIKINGKTYDIPQYGSFSHGANDVVNVFIPQGNMNLAFFI